MLKKIKGKSNPLVRCVVSLVLLVCMLCQLTTPAIATTITGNTTINTQRTAENFEITFNVNNMGKKFNVTLNPDNNILKEFYDIPEFENDATHNEYIFKGWYLDEDNENDSRPLEWNKPYDSAFNVYAHWISADSVDKENDRKSGVNGYGGFDLAGVQIRQNAKDPSGKAYQDGLRFVTSLSNSVYDNLSEISSTKLEYGYLLALTSNITEDVPLEYNEDNASNIHKIVCSGSTDHYKSKAYRLYTLVMTYDMSGSDITEAEAKTRNMIARSYIKYTDANGLERYHYSNYTGNSQYAKGCNTNFNAISKLQSENNQIH